MKLLILLTSILLSASPGLFAQTAQFSFDQANSLIEEGDYRGALNGYRAIEETGLISGPLYLNMGISAIQIDSLGLAKYYLLKATNFAGVEDEAEKALEYVQSQFSRQSATLPKLPWDKAIDWIKTGPGAFGVFLLGYAFGVLSLFLLLGRWFNVVQFTRQQNYILSLFISSLILISLAFYVDYVSLRYDEGILISQETRVLQQPEENSEVIGMAYEGYTLTIDNKTSKAHEQWYYIRLGNGQYGWINRKGVETL